MRRVSICSAAVNRFDDHRRFQNDGNDLGDEDLPLLEDRKPGSSQNFDSFEIFSSHMGLNSPRMSKSILMPSLNESDIQELADDDNAGTRSDLFEDSAYANLEYLDGKFVRRGSEFHIQASSDDEVYSTLHVTLPPASQTYKRQDADGGDVMHYHNFSSSGPSAYHLPLEKELSRGIVRGRFSLSAANSSNRHGPESSTQPDETNFRNPPSLEDSPESEHAADDRDDILSDSIFGTEYGASISDLFSSRGTDPLADKDLPLAHSQSADGTHPCMAIPSPSLLAASKRRWKTSRVGFVCSSCSSQDFTTKHNLYGKTNSADLCCVFADECIPDHIYSHYHMCVDCESPFATKISLPRHRKRCKGSETKALPESAQQSNQFEDNSIIEIERPMSGTVPCSDD